MTKEEKKDARKAEKKQRKEDLKKLVAFIEANAGKKVMLSDDVVALALAQKKKARTNGITGMKAVIRNMFHEVGVQVSEDQIWSDLKLGRAEMRKLTVNLIKKEAPEDRVWVSFNAEEGVYTCEGFGPDAPEGWTGYTPVKVEDIEIM